MNARKTLGDSACMARPEGLEPPAYWFEANRSIRLSYGRVPVSLYVAPAILPHHRLGHPVRPDRAVRARYQWRAVQQRLHKVLNTGKVQVIVRGKPLISTWIHQFRPA